MAEPDPIYETPVSQPVTPPVESDEGYPLAPGLTSVQSLTAAPTGFPNVREVKRDQGVNYYVGSTLATLEQVEGGRFNDTRRMIYRAYQRFARLLFLQIGIVDGGASPPFAADYDVDGFPTALLGKAWEFAAENVAGGGNEKKILITWTDADVLPTPSINNARALARVSDGKELSSIQIGDSVIDERAASFSDAQILDIEYHGVDGDDHTATLTLNKPLLAAREDKVWIVRSNLQYTFPPISLRFETNVCRHAIRRSDNTFPSYKAAYPSAYVSQGISGAWHCARMNNPTALISTFEPFHINTLCPLYEVHSQYLPAAFDISEIFISRGWYNRRESLLTNVFRNGLENYPGILQLIGVLNGFDSFANQLRSKDTLFFGVLKFKTGNTTDQGFAEFLDFAAIQQAHLDANPIEDETDVGTALEIFTTVPDKFDPAGGADSSNRLLIDDPDRTPGNTLAKHMGVRRISSRLLGQGAMDPGLSYGDKGTLSGAGTEDVQRVRHVRRTSFAFTKGVVNTLRGEKTTVDVFATPQTLPASGETYDIVLGTARFSDKANAPEARTPKINGGIAANISFTAELMTVEFGMTDYELSRPDLFDQPDIINTAKMGGGFVASDIAHVIRNPGEGEGVQFMGDPERLVFPGDVITFDDDAVRDIALTCVSAKAFSGSVDPAAVAPNAAAPGVPQFVRDNFAKRDVAIFALSPENGAAIEQFVTAIGASEQNVVIDYVAHGAVAPPEIDADLNDTDYTPILKKTYKTSGVTDIVPEAQYLYDPNLGAFYIDSSTWAAGDYVLFVEMWVFDVRKVYPCSVSSAYESLLDGLCELYRQASLSLTSSGYVFSIDDDSPFTTINPLYFSALIPAFGSGDPPVPFTLADGLINQVEYLGENIIRTYLDPASPGSFIIGCNPGAGDPDYQYQAPAFSFDEIIEIARWDSSEIEEVWIEISFKDPVITEAWIDRTLDENDDPVIDSGSDTSITSLNMTIALLSKTSGAEYDLQSTGLSVEFPTTKITIDGDVYLRGTVNITNLSKYVIDNITTAGIEFLMMATGGALPAGPIGGEEIATGWISYFFSNDNGIDPYTAGIRTLKLEFSQFEMFDIYIKTKASELENGPELPRTSEGLIFDNPDLTFDPS